MFSIAFGHNHRVLNLNAIIAGENNASLKNFVGCDPIKPADPCNRHKESSYVENVPKANVQVFNLTV